MSVSVCTLARGRAGHLANLVTGLTRSRTAPDELVIAVLQDEPYDLPETDFPVHQEVLGSEGIPLALGRNTAARAANGTLLVFLDVDCIAHPRLIDDYVSAARRLPGVLMGEVGYLPKGATRNGVDHARFERLAQTHADRPGPPDEAFSQAHDYRCFWSLNFAISARDFERAGGFDESFVGYGGEDTDFGRSLVEAGIELWWLRGAKAYHQHHGHHMPPVHHLESVLANAERFREKWGHHTMEHWLRAFTLMGLIERRGEKEGGGFRILREPDARDLAFTRQHEDEAYASSAAVLEQLEAEAAQADPAGARARR